MNRPHPRSLPGFFILAACAGALLPSTSIAREPVRIPPPPPPGKVVRDIRGFIHRVANGVKDAGKQTLSAVRERFTERDEEEAPPRSRRPPSRSYSGDGISLDSPPRVRSKETVPRGRDDAETATSGAAPAGADAMPKVNVIPRDAAKSGPFTSPGEQVDPGPASETAPADPKLPPRNPSVPPKVTASDDEPKIEFARPVPGKRGLVYPPGVNESSENMVDVDGFQSGQIVRDPRSGKLFRVP